MTKRKAEYLADFSSDSDSESVKLVRAESVDNAQGEVKSKTFQRRTYKKRRTSQVDSRTREQNDSHEDMRLIHNMLYNLSDSSTQICFGEAYELLMPDEFDFGCRRVTLPFEKPSQLGDLTGKYSEGDEDGGTMEFDNVYSATIEYKENYWEDCLDNLIKRVCKNLSCFGEYEVEYERFIGFKNGKRSPRIKLFKRNTSRVFGKLIIQLPSKFTGGKLDFYDDNENVKLSYDFGKSNKNTEDKFYFIAFHSSVDYQFHEVKSGFRGLLVYNLCWKKDSKNNMILGQDELDDEASRHFLKQTLEKVLANNENLSQILTESKPSILSDLIFALLAIEEYQSQLENVTNKIVQNITQNNLHELLKLFNKYLDVDFEVQSPVKHDQLMRLYQHRLNHLKQQILYLSEFKWSMPEAKFPDHPEIEEFLKSEEQSLDFKNDFGSIIKAKKFIEKWSLINSTYSMKMEAKGKGKLSYVYIEKTKEYFQSLMEQKPNFEKEINEIQSLLN